VSGTHPLSLLRRQESFYESEEDRVRLSQMTALERETIFLERYEKRKAAADRQRAIGQLEQLMSFKPLHPGPPESLTDAQLREELQHRGLVLGAKEKRENLMARLTHNEQTRQHALKSSGNVSGSQPSCASASLSNSASGPL